MNIHFKDKDLFKQLIDSTLVKVKVGSHMYGLDDESSDTDYLCIYVPSINERNSFSFSHHQLQFKDLENDIDYNFVNIFNFIRNTINGDSTINFEVINSEQLKGTSLEFLYDMKEDFNNYMVIRSYLGLARRDCKHISSGSTDREKNKRLIHAFRGFYFAKNIYDDTFTNILVESKLNELVEMKSITDYKKRNTKTSWITQNIDDFREFINRRLDAGELTKFMKVENQKKLDFHLSNLLVSGEYKHKQLYHMDLSMIYDANENGIKY